MLVRYTRRRWLALLVLVSSGCGLEVRVPISAPTQEAPRATATEVVRVGQLATIGEAGQFLADAQGYFAEQHLAIDVVRFSGAEGFPALLTGQVEVLGNAADARVFATVANDVDIRAVASQASSAPHANGLFLVVRKDLIEGGRVREFADLKGCNIALPAKASVNGYVLARAMQAGGLLLEDAAVSEMGFPNILPALASRAVDVGVLAEPFASIAVRNGDAVKWKGFADIVPGVQQTVVLFSQQLMAHREVAVAWLTAYLRGVRDYNDAFVKGLHRAQTINALMKSLAQTDAQLYDEMGFAYEDPDGKIDVDSLTDHMHWYVESGYLAAPVDVARLVDSSMAAEVVARLAQYH
jgi:NitT/TauT family transport system substrate-binding protein